MKRSPLEDKITQMIEPVINGRGLSLVLVRVSGEGGEQTLQIFAENPETRNLGLEDCTALSREISAMMDVEDPIQSAYRLEISSPGIARPLTRLQDFQDFAGFEAKVEISPPLDGQKRFRGFLRGVNDDGQIVLDTDQGEQKLLDANSVQKARLVLSDELIKAMAPANPANAQTE